MYLKDLAKFIYVKDTSSQNMKITVQTHGIIKRVLWTGKAKDLQKWDKINGWLVVEVLIDQSDESEPCDYNKGKIIIVI